MMELKQIADRVREMREIMEIEAGDIAEKIGVSLEEYLAYENAEDDIPIGKLYLIADELGLDPTVLLIGDNPKMAEYSLVRAGHGINVERYAGYRFSSLAYNFISREMEPMIVTISESDERPELVSHEGQEFNYIIEGKMLFKIGEITYELEEGDSVYFDSGVPHAEKALDGKPARFLAIVMK